jgi:Flp pilus assembly protein TadD
MIPRLAALVLITLAVTWTFAPAREFAFLNWDDEAVIAGNAALDSPRVVQWAFTTTYMEHYQPLSWLVWAAIKRIAGASPAAFHDANILVHLLCAVLLFAAALTLLRRAAPDVPAVARDAAAAVAALLYAVHPLRVEVVAWVSAFPYALALALVSCSLLAWLRTTSPPKTRWWIAALLLYVASLLARPIALGFPVVLVAIDTTLLARTLRSSLARVWPFTIAALGAGLIEGLARAPAANDVPWMYRLQSAALAPFVYVWRTIAPLGLTPLDALPENPAANVAVVATALLALAALGAALWHWRGRQPLRAAVVIAYLALLAPAAGLAAGGLQQTADRYTYLPGVVLAVVVASAGLRWSAGRASRQRVAAGVAVVLIAGSAIAARQALTPWHDSIALWDRVVTLDADNHVALYNLGTALAAAGRTDDAAARYRQVLTRVPAHAQARANLDRLEAARFERAGNDAATRGDLPAAAEHYARAIALDAGRTHSHAALGAALAALGRSNEAIPALREAFRRGAGDTVIPNTLAMLLVDAGDVRGARAVLEVALTEHRSDVGLAHNLARLLATNQAFAKTDAPLALRLANAVVDATGGSDPRMLDTLAAALAINGRMREAADVSARAAALADAQGDQEMSAQITVRGRAYRSSGR